MSRLFLEVCIFVVLFPHIFSHIFRARQLHYSVPRKIWFVADV